ncbi:MAG: ABC transporter substrate-binding protein [Bacteroidetes bacterium]|nr:ABC transporter substrate-binding protein [Bacteroidota bacterium]MCL5025529.1 ABC transporter substrate-binding protein [Chloroflexota bacterium]
MKSMIWKLTLFLACLSLFVACVPAAPTAAPAAPTAAPAVPTKPVAAPTAAPTAPPAAASPTLSAKIKRGGALRVGNSATYDRLDPQLSQVVTQAGMRMMFDALLTYELNPKSKLFEVGPDLVEKWEQPDAKTIVLKVRQGVKFQDGSPLNAEAVKFNIDRMRNNPKSFAKSSVTAVDSVQVVDASTVKVSLKVPSASALPSLSGYTSPTSIVSKEAVEKLGDDEFGRHPVGSGPMVLGEWVQDDHVTYKKWDGYWRKGEDGQPLPYLDSATFRYMPDASVMLLELKAGNLDTVENVEPKDVAGVKANPELTYAQLPWGLTFYFHHGYNQRSGPFADNLKLRQAAEHAVDRDSMAKTLAFGLGGPAPRPLWGPGMIGYDETLPSYEFSPTKAKQLLSDAGYPNGLDVTLSVISRSREQRIAEITKSMWDAVGIRTTLEVLERLAFNAKLQSFNFQAGFWTGGTQLDPDLLSRYLTTGGVANWSGWSDPEMDKCMEDGRSTLDMKQREQIYKRCQQIIYERAFIGTGYYEVNNDVYNKRVNGIRNQFLMRDYRDVWLSR